jgi:Transposase DDE domain group 1
LKDDSSLSLDFPALSLTLCKEVVARFDGGEITSDAGLVLLSQADRSICLTQALADAIDDQRQVSKVEHTYWTLLQQRIYAIACGYPDANDLNTLRHDPALKLACGRCPKTEPALASQPSLSRFENTLTAKDLLRMGKVVARKVIAQLPQGTKRVILDVDASDDPCHGQQEFEFFNRHYDCHCFLPLYLFVTDESGCQRLLSILLRPGKAGATLGLTGLLRQAVSLLRERFPHTKIVLRADAGFGCDKVLRLCDRLRIGYVLGLAQNSRLQEFSTSCQIRAAIRHKFEGDGCREWGSFLYKAHSWHKERQVVVKAEVTRGELNPRYIVFGGNSGKDGGEPFLSEKSPQDLYLFYCGRGDIENRIKEMKLDLNSGRTSCHSFLANQARLLLFAAAGVLLGVLKQAAFDTKWAKATLGTLRLRLLKVGARVVESYRKIWLHLPTSFPEQATWRTMHQRLLRA